MDEHDMERRRFLCVLGATGAAATVVSATGCGDSAMPAAPFAAGRVADHPQGLWKIYRAQKVAVGRDAMGFFAFSLLCPHEGYDLSFRAADGACMGTALCTTASMSGSLVCESGHGGTFDGNGTRTAGPPMTNLPHYQVTVSAGALTVNPGVSVAASARSMG
jgi:nitrite reductase/ring-hydroxylating ferredoxin subunit